MNRIWKKKLLDIAQFAPDTVILAEDEAALYLQATSKRVWSPRGKTPIVKVSPSRDSVKFYGTINVKTSRVIISESEKLDSEHTARYLKSLLKKIPHHPILLLWDRATWHGGDPVREVLAENPRMEIMKLPVAAPELNPQEQVWKRARDEVSHNHHHNRLDHLADEFVRFIQRTTW